MNSSVFKNFFFLCYYFIYVFSCQGGIQNFYRSTLIVILQITVNLIIPFTQNIYIYLFSCIRGRPSVSTTSTEDGVVRIFESFFEPRQTSNVVVFHVSASSLAGRGQPSCGLQAIFEYCGTTSIIYTYVTIRTSYPTDAANFVFPYYGHKKIAYDLFSKLLNIYKSLSSHLQEFCYKNL